LSDGTFYIETYGCQMNEHDSEKMAAVLNSMGLTQVPEPERADVVLINTCSIREKAEHKVYSALGKLKPLKKKNPLMVTMVAGCVAQQKRADLLKRVGHLDAVVGTHQISDLPSIIRRVREDNARVNATEFASRVGSLHLDAPCLGPSRVWSYVTVMQGCSNFCAYCVVPFTRGPEQSRPHEEIVRDVRGLIDKGYKEVTLLGQNVNAYGRDLSNGTNFPSLLKELDRIEGLARIRFTTSHPRDFGPELARAMADFPTVCEHIHLPLQSGSDRVLKAMGRGYTFGEYVAKVEMLREMIPNVAVTADMIVGFPGESDEDFEQTLSALERIRYDQIFSFKFSPRPGTRAQHLPNQITDEIKAARLEQVHAIQDRVTLDYHRASEGTVEEVLIEGVKEGSGQPYGRTRTNKIVNLDRSNCAKPGELIPVKITRGLKHSLVGEIVSLTPKAKSL
jgi:tRNA-2-methylthio-N6-dimethylallyladenosine synthase